MLMLTSLAIAAGVSDLQIIFRQLLLFPTSSASPPEYVITNLEACGYMHESEGPFDLNRDNIRRIT
jgi:hypothetical protein